MAPAVALLVRRTAAARRKVTAADPTRRRRVADNQELRLRPFSIMLVALLVASSMFVAWPHPTALAMRRNRRAGGVRSGRHGALRLLMTIGMPVRLRKLSWRTGSGAILLWLAPWDGPSFHGPARWSCDLHLTGLWICTAWRCQPGGWRRCPGSSRTGCHRTRPVGSSMALGVHRHHRRLKATMTSRHLAAASATTRLPRARKISRVARLGGRHADRSRWLSAGHARGAMDPFMTVRSTLQARTSRRPRRGSAGHRRAFPYRPFGGWSEPRSTSRRVPP